MKFIIAEFTANKHHNEYTTGNTDGKTKNVDCSISFVPQKISHRYFQIVFYYKLLFYSVLNDFTGFASAAFIAWKLIVNKAMLIAMNAVIAKTNQLIFVL